MVKVFSIADVTVTTAGTEVQLSSTTIRASSVTIQALNTNTGFIYVGDSNVASGRGIELDAGQAITISADLSGRPGGDEIDLSDIYVDSSVNGEKVKVVYQKRQ